MTHNEDAQRSYDWNMHLGALKQFKERNGHCNVMTSELRKWVSYVRTLATVDAELAKKRGGMYLTEEQKDELKKLDFVWKVEDERILKEADDPKDKRTDGTAVANHEKFNSKPNDKIEKQKQSSQNGRDDIPIPPLPLNKIGKIRFQVPITPSSRVKFPPEESRSTPVSIVKKISANVKNVINEQSHSVEHTSDHPHRFADSNYGNNKDWSQCFEMLKCFQEKYGHTQVPYKRFPHNHTLTVLSNFVLQMREQLVLKMHDRPNLLTQEREDMLNSIKFEWKTNFECTKEGVTLTKKSKPSPSSAPPVVASKPKKVTRAKKNGTKSNVGIKRPVVVDSEGTLWAVYKPLAVDRLLDVSKTARCIPDRPPTPENWGVELAYESDGSNDSLTF
jgi:hypothetical protein